MPSILIIALIMTSVSSLGESTQQTIPSQEPTGKQIAESLGYHTGPKGWENVDRTDPWIQRRIKDRL